ncbi:MAG: LysM peptidoglycan-binding domain-containing protein [Chloroflexota bacterium]|nr:LysM peptidoglycan-binding domain-containing protein [Chloroflexota bacterium]
MNRDLSSRSAAPKGGLYLDMVDLYAARVTNARTILITDPEPLKVIPLHRGRRLSSPGRGRAFRLVSATVAVLIVLSIVARTALAEQTYRVQEGDTIHLVSQRFDVDAKAIVDANNLEGVAHLYPGQELIIPGIADGDAGTGYVAGTYEVVYGDTIASIAWNLHVSTVDLLSLNGLTADSTIYPGDILFVPDAKASKQETIDALNELDAGQLSAEIDTEASDDVADQVAETSLPASASVWVPSYWQQRNLSCEYASTYIATAAFGAGIPESAFWNWIPVTSNPHWGYRGNIDGWWGNTTDYGIYPEPLVPVLNHYGFGAEVFYAGSDSAQLMQQIAWGRPVVVWLAMWGNTAEHYTDEGSYTVFSGMHVMTAYGYDEAGVYLSDPARGGTVFFDWGTFLWMWGTINGMAMAVYPL